MRNAFRCFSCCLRRKRIDDVDDEPLLTAQQYFPSFEAQMLCAAAAKGDFEAVQRFVSECTTIAINERDDSGRTALFRAVEHNHPKIAELLLDLGASAEMSAGLSMAARLAPESTGAAPIAIGASVSMSPPRPIPLPAASVVGGGGGGGLRPLHVAAFIGSVLLCRLLLSRSQIDVNSRVTRANVTPLLIAVREGHLETVQCLIEFGADVNINDHSPPPRKARRQSQIDTDSGAGAPRHSKPTTSASFSMVPIRRSNSTNSIASIAVSGQSSRKDPNRFGATDSNELWTHSSTTATTANATSTTGAGAGTGTGTGPETTGRARKGSGTSEAEYSPGEVLQMLCDATDSVLDDDLDLAPDPSTTAATPDAPTVAADKKSHTADVCSRDRRSPSLRDRRGRGSYARVGRTPPIVIASQCGYTRLVQYLVEHGRARTDARDFRGLNALMYAAKLGHSETVAYLLSSPANQTAAAAANTTKTRSQKHQAYYYSSSTPTTSSTPASSSMISPIHSRSDDGDLRTALHFAAIGGHADTAALLLRNSAQIDARDADGRTPLHLAAKFGHPKVVTLLILYGADTSIRDFGSRRQKQRRKQQQKQKQQQQHSRYSRIATSTPPQTSKSGSFLSFSLGIGASLLQLGSRSSNTAPNVALAAEDSDSHSDADSDNDDEGKLAVDLAPESIQYHRVARAFKEALASANGRNAANSFASDGPLDSRQSQSLSQSLSHQSQSHAHSQQQRIAALIQRRNQLQLQQQQQQFEAANDEAAMPPPLPIGARKRPQMPMRGTHVRFYSSDNFDPAAAANHLPAANMARDVSTANRKRFFLNPPMIHNANEAQQQQPQTAVNSAAQTAIQKINNNYSINANEPFVG